MKSPNRRSYQQFCYLARSLDVVGERWTLLLVRELLLGPRRYSDLLERLPGLTTNLLATRLKRLEADGLIKKITPLGARSRAYDLTERGAALESVILSLCHWGDALMDTPRSEERIDIAWGLLSMKLRFRGGKNLRALFEIDERLFTLTFEDDYLRVNERGTDAPDLHLRGPLLAFRRWLFMGTELGSLEAKGAIEVAGKVRDRQRLLRAFDRLN